MPGICSAASCKSSLGIGVSASSIRSFFNSSLWLVSSCSATPLDRHRVYYWFEVIYSIYSTITDIIINKIIVLLNCKHLKGIWDAQLYRSFTTWDSHYPVGRTSAVSAPVCQHMRVLHAGEGANFWWALPVLQPGYLNQRPHRRLGGRERWWWCL